MSALILASLLLAGPTPTDPQAPKQAAATGAAPAREGSDDLQALYRLGLAYLAAGEPRDAVPPLRALVKKDPTAVDAVVLLARALRLSGEAQEAKLLLDGTIASVPDDAQLHAERGLLARALDETDIAIDHYLKAVELSPRDGELHFNLGEALQKRGRVDPAIDEYRKALELNPELTAAEVNLGKALAEKGQYPQAKEVLVSLTRRMPNEPEAHYNLAVLLMREENISAAIGEYQKTLAINSKHASAHNNLGVALDALGDHRRALEEFKKAIGADPSYAEAHFNLGLSYFRFGDNLRATQEFETALKLAPRQASDPYVQLGELYLQQGKKDRALEAFKRAVHAMKESGRRNIQAYRGLALAYLGLNQPGDAVNTLRLAVEELPNEPSAHAALADALVAQGDLDRAIEEYSRRLKLEPTADATLDLARAYSKKRVASKAEPLFQQVLKSSPGHYSALLGLADLYLAMGRYNDAEKALAKAQTIDPKDPSTMAKLGILHSRRGRPDLALPELEVATQRDPTQLDAKAELGLLYGRGGDPDRGLKVLNAVLVASPKHPLTTLYLGYVLYQKGQRQRVQEAFTAASKLDPSSADPHYALGQLYEAQNKLPEALTEYERAVSLQKDHSDAVAASKRLAASRATGTQSGASPAPEENGPPTP